MMIRHAFLFALALAAAATLPACKSDPRAEAPATRPAADAEARVRNEGYALLLGLLKKEIAVENSLIMRKVEPGLEETLRSISRVSREGAKQIEAYAERSPSIQLGAMNLPVVERETRDAIEIAETKALVSKSFQQDEFMLHLLITQTKALKYGVYLAESLARHEPDVARKTLLETIAKQYRELDEKVLTYLSLKATTKP